MDNFTILNLGMVGFSMIILPIISLIIINFTIITLVVVGLDIITLPIISFS